MACDARSSRYGRKSATNGLPNVLHSSEWRPQRGLQFDALIALVRASRPQSFWHLHKARSRVATHIRVEQIPGLMQSACHEALALATARKAKTAPLTRTSANLYTEQRPFVSFMKSAQQLHLQIVPSLSAASARTKWSVEFDPGAIPCGPLQADNSNKCNSVIPALIHM